MNLLIKDIKTRISLSREEEEQIKEAVISRAFNRKEILETYHSIYKNIYFVKKGCIQLCLIGEQGKEHTIQFSIKNGWLTDYDSFNYQKKSFYQLKTVKPSELIILPKNTVDVLCSNIPKLAIYFKLIAERMYAATLFCISLMMTISKEKRYHYYTQHFPRFAKEIPQYVLASYLNISPEYLSEIKNKNIKPV